MSALVLMALYAKVIGTPEREPALVWRSVPQVEIRRIPHRGMSRCAIQRTITFLRAQRSAKVGWLFACAVLSRCCAGWDGSCPPQPSRESSIPSFSSDRAIRSVYVDGRYKVRDGRLAGIDEQELVTKVREMAEPFF